MTMLELLVVLGVIGMAMFLGFYVVSAVTKSALRSDTVEVAAALKSAHNLAAQSGMHHRVVFDLDKQTYRIEVCPDPIQLKRGDEEEKIDAEALEKLKEQPNPLQAANSLGLGPGLGGLGSATEAVSEADSPEAALKAAAALKGMRRRAQLQGSPAAEHPPARQLEQRHQAQAGLRPAPARGRVVRRGEHQLLPARPW